MYINWDWVEVGLTTYGDWQTFKRFTVSPGQTFTYRFPEGYSAHWLCLKTDVASTVTAQLEYK